MKVLAAAAGGIERKKNKFVASWDWGLGVLITQLDQFRVKWGRFSFST